jgi:hypothetical protein
MKLKTLMFWASIIITLAIVGGVHSVAHKLEESSNSARPQQTPAPSPSPPVDQQWKVEYGDISELEIKLRELNKLSRSVDMSEIHISSDGKRYVIVVANAYAGDDEDSEQK